MIEITKINHTGIIEYKNLRSSGRTFVNNKIFIAEGEKVVQKLLESKLIIESLFALPQYYEKYKDLIEKKAIPELKRLYADKKIMDEIVGFNMHKGIMAAGIQPEEKTLTSMGNRVVGMNAIVDSENVGSIVRNASAFGFDTILFDNATSSPYLRRAVRVSMGSIFDLGHCMKQNLPEAIFNLKDSGYSVISAEIHEKAIPILNFKFSEKYILILGSEGKGISKEILDLSDHIVYIPHSHNVRSLNVSASSAIIFHEANKLE